MTNFSDYGPYYGAIGVREIQVRPRVVEHRILVGTGIHAARSAADNGAGSLPLGSSASRLLCLSAPLPFGSASYSTP